VLRRIAPCASARTAAKQFVDAGSYVFITGRREAELSRAVKEIGSNVTGVQGDVSKLSDLDRLFAQIKRDKGKLDIVFANAGLARYAGSVRLRGTVQLHLRYKCERGPFHGAEGVATAAGWPIHHPECLCRWQQRVFIQQRLQYHKGCRGRHEPGTSRPHIERSCICAPITGSATSS